jgi:2'-5' RNA ligase
MNHRIFIGIFVDEETKASILDWQNKFKGDFKVRWTKPENLHITVIPPMVVPEEDLEGVIQKFKMAELSKTFNLHFRSISFGLTRSKVEYIWLNGATAEELIEIKNTFENIFGKNDQREYHPHVTIGRVQEKKDQFREELINWTMEINKVSLIKSETFPEGAKYTEIAEIDL